HEDANAPHLLRPGPERPRGRAPNQRNELAPPHSTPSFYVDRNRLSDDLTRGAWAIAASQRMRGALGRIDHMQLSRPPPRRLAGTSAYPPKHDAVAGTGRISGLLPT